ncbi:MAG: hypothetical protein ABUL60_11995 [Myxococcales bacterium]
MGSVEWGQRPRAWQVVAITLGLVVAGFLLRWYLVGRSIHQDSLLWFERSQEFWRALARHRWHGTYQAPHPGVPMMWIAGFWLQLHGLLSSHINTQGVLAIKLPGVIVGTLAAALTFPLLLALLGKSQWRPALVLGVLFTTEPVLVQESRIGHLDMTALGFAWLGMLLALIAYEHNRRLALLAGVCFGFSALTRLSIAALPIALLSILFAGTALTKFRDRRGLWVALISGLSTLITIYAFWPATWSHPVDIVHRALTQSTDLIGRKRAASAGEMYGSFLLPRPTPETFVLALLGLGVSALSFARPLRKHFALLALAILPYLIVVLLTPKKSVRYALPVVPILLMLATLGVEWLAQRIGRLRRVTTVALTSALGLATAGRFAHAAALLPTSAQCTPWPGVDCTRPDRMYFVRDVGRAIRDDWRDQQGEGSPRVYGGAARQLAPWVPLKTVNRARRADYLVIWDVDFDDAEKGTLGRAARREYARRGAEIAVIRDEGAVVARVYRRR